MELAFAVCSVEWSDRRVINPRYHCLRVPELLELFEVDRAVPVVVHDARRDDDLILVEHASVLVAQLDEGIERQSAGCAFAAATIVLVESLDTRELPLGRGCPCWNAV